MQLFHAIETPLDEPVEVGAGASLILEGWAFCPQAGIRRLFLDTGNHARHAVGQFSNARQDVLVAHHKDDPRHDIRALRSGFWTTLPIRPSPRPRTMEIRLIAELANGETLVSAPQAIRLLGTPAAFSRRGIYAEVPENPRVAICMTTYNPDEAVLRRQIESIRRQTLTNWICLIQDDWSSRASVENIRRVIGDDPRFVLECNERNLGFYLNFQKVLRRVPADCALVALADQDDRWYPHKLAMLVQQFDAPDVTMAYSDMHIVDGAGQIVSKTFWSTRRNNYTDLETLFFANTITGAACMFKAALLPLILPFPPKRGHIYHDWWLGLVALAAGTIRYVDEPLYDYYQHGSNAVGWSHIGRIVSIKQFLTSDSYRRELAHVARGMYNYDCKFLAATIDTLRLRIPDSHQEKALRRLAGLPQRPIRTLMAQSMRAVALQRASQNREKNVLMAHTVMRLLNGYFQRKHRELAAKFATPEEAAANDPGARASGAGGARQVMPVDTFERKCQPLTLKVDPQAPARINMFLATIDFKYFFGGYIGMFRLAKHIAQAGSGVKVRFILVEPTDFQPQLWRQNIQKYAGLEDIFDLVEVEYRFDRSIPLTVSPKDRFIATSCWSAWLAHFAARDIAKARDDGAPAKRFLFMIQEYEPYFVPHGSYYALSHAAYDLPQFGFFSTEILREFFRQNRFGVFRHSPADGDALSASFHNAVLKFDVTHERIKSRGGHRAAGKRKFLFYCRPEAHAQRNMFELGILALRQAINAGHFDPREWEFYGIGTVGEQFVIPLPKGAQMTALPKMSLEEYADYLPDFDVGMSLMFTPHPSLVPLEMAAAGLITITNSYANKTADALRNISTNFEVGEATIDDLAAALTRSAGRVDDIPARVAGSHIHWPTDWEQALSPAVLTPVLLELLS